MPWFIACFESYANQVGNDKYTPNSHVTTQQAFMSFRAHAALPWPATKMTMNEYMLVSSMGVQQQGVTERSICANYGMVKLTRWPTRDSA